MNILVISRVKTLFPLPASLTNLLFVNHIRIHRLMQVQWVIKTTLEYKVYARSKYFGPAMTLKWKAHRVGIIRNVTYASQLRTRFYYCFCYGLVVTYSYSQRYNGSLFLKVKQKRYIMLKEKKKVVRKWNATLHCWQNKKMHGNTQAGNACHYWVLVLNHMQNDACLFTSIHNQLDSPYAIYYSYMTFKHMNTI